MRTRRFNSDAEMVTASDQNPITVCDGANGLTEAWQKMRARLIGFSRMMNGLII